MQASSMLCERPGCLRGERREPVEGERAGKTRQDHKDLVRHRGEAVEAKHWGIAALRGPLTLLGDQFLREGWTL